MCIKLLLFFIILAYCVFLFVTAENKESVKDEYNAIAQKSYESEREFKSHLNNGKIIVWVFGGCVVRVDNGTCWKQNPCGGHVLGQTACPDQNMKILK